MSFKGEIVCHAEPADCSGGRGTTLMTQEKRRQGSALGLMPKVKNSKESRSIVTDPRGVGLLVGGLATAFFVGKEVVFMMTQPRSQSVGRSLTGCTTTLNSPRLGWPLARFVCPSALCYRRDHRRCPLATFQDPRIGLRLCRTFASARSHP